MAREASETSTGETLREVEVIQYYWHRLVGHLVRREMEITEYYRDRTVRKCSCGIEFEFVPSPGLVNNYIRAGDNYVVCLRDHERL